jgi:hypothetical protein
LREFDGILKVLAKSFSESFNEASKKLRNLQKLPAQKLEEFLLSQ